MAEKDIDMTAGIIIKIVNSFGATWGRVRSEDGRESFFNEASLAPGNEFADLKPGQAMEFREEKDQVNGSRAVEMRATVASAEGPVAQAPAL